MVARILRRVFFGVVTLAAVAAGGEGLARITGAGSGTFPSPFPFQELPRTVARVAGARLYVAGRTRVAPTVKAGRRFLLFGESAAEGDGYAPWVGMGGVAERTLRHALTGPVELINMATPGLGSRQIAEMVRTRVSDEALDGLIFYVGNNELHELRGLKTVMPHYDAHTELLRRRLWRSHAYRALARFLIPPPTPFEVPVGKWPALGTLTTQADADDRALAMLLFEENFRTILGIAAAAHLPVVLSTVAVNEFDWVDGEGSAEERSLFDQAQTQERAGKHAEAVRLFHASESVATRPVRALPEARSMERQLAGEYGVTLCDIDLNLSQLSAHRVPGSQWFNDACHPNLEGHAQIGRMLAACTLTAIGEPAGSAPLERIPAVRLDGWAESAGVRPVDDGSAEAALRTGNAAFTAKQLDQAAAAYTEAERRGAAPGIVAWNRGLAALYSGNLTAAREYVKTAQPYFPDDAEVRATAATLGL